MEIKATIFPDAEVWLKENLPDMGVDSVAAVHRTSEVNLDGVTSYKDFEENKVKHCKLQDHLEALQLLCDKIGKTLFVGGLRGATELADAGNWDVEVVDAYYQLVFYKEVIYG